jgi:hypothetical protein
METPDTAMLARQWAAMGVPARDIRRALHTFNAWAPGFREEGEAHDE